MQSLSVATKKSSAKECALELLDAAPPVVWHIRRVMQGHRSGLSVPQFRAMVMIANQPCISLSYVAENLALSLPTTSRIVTGLVNKGFLKRQPCADDRRQMSLGITSRGRSVLSGAWSAAQQSMADELEHFTPKQRASLVDAMQMVKKVFGSMGVGGGNDER
jgi:DNA-binding MarR family transcriptional regulator